MKKMFLTGLAILLPIAITCIVIVFIFDFLTAPFVGMTRHLILHYGGEIAVEHQTLLLFLSRIAVLILLVAFIFLLGFLARQLFFSFLLRLTQRLFTKIPIIKTVYRITQEITQNILKQDKKKLFQATVVVPFSHLNTYALGLLSKTSPPTAIQKEIPEAELRAVFVPTAPHPISGFLLLYEQKEIKKTEIVTEDLFKFLLSCGLLDPEKGSNDKTTD